MFNYFVKDVCEIAKFVAKSSIIFGCMYGNVWVSNLFITTACKFLTITPYVNPDIGLELLPCLVLIGAEFLIYDYYTRS